MAGMKAVSFALLVGVASAILGGLNDVIQQGQDAARDAANQAGAAGREMGRNVRDSLGSCTSDVSQCQSAAKDNFRQTLENAQGMSERAVDMKFREALEQGAKDKAKESLGGCSGSASEMATCVQSRSATLTSELRSFVADGTQNVDAIVRENLRGAKEDLANADFLTCSRDSSKNAATCAREMMEKRTALGLDMLDEVAARGLAYGRDFASRMGDCNATAGDTDKSCREAAMMQAKASGMPDREWAVVKEMAEKRGPAEVFGRCRDSGETEANCENMLKDEFEKLSGQGRASMSADMLTEIKAMGNAIRMGVKIVVVKRPQILVNVLSNGTSCVDAIKEWFTRKTGEKAMMNASAIVMEAVSRVCRIIDAFAEYRCTVKTNGTDEEMASLSDELAGGWENEELDDDRRLEEVLMGGEQVDLSPADIRRLSGVYVSASYASQEVVECPETDSSCTGVEYTTTPTSDPGTVSGATHAVATGALLAALLARIL